MQTFLGNAAVIISTFAISTYLFTRLFNYVTDKL